MMILLISSCVSFWINNPNRILRNMNNRIEKMVKKIDRECEKECKIDGKYSYEWCNCMNICLNMDEGTNYCLTDSINFN